MTIRLLTLIGILSIFGMETIAQIHTCYKRDGFKNKSLKSNTLSVSQIAETEKYDVHFYGLDLSMTNLTTDVSGTVTITATAKENLDSALLELFPSLSISEVRLNGNPTTFSRNNTAVNIFVNQNTGSLFELAIDYSGTPPSGQTNPLGGSGMSQGNSPTWGNEVVWSLSEPFCAMEWFPCKQSLTDKADSSYFSITVPPNLKAGSNGLLESIETLPNGDLKFNWKHRHPIDYYLISVSVSEYVDYSIYAHPTNAPDSILIQNYIYNNPQTLPYFKNDIDETADFIELFYDLFGPYPFEDEKYGHCMAPFSGGMEHQTMTTQGFFNNTLTAHELGHQWWGDNVTCASWADIWVNEGFASYSEYLMLENLYPLDKDQHMVDVHSNVMNQTGGSVWVLDSLNENRIFSGRLTYDKGAAIIHTMRFILNNDDLFFQTLRDFQVNYEDSTAHGIDFRNKLEENSGINFTPMFEQWYFGEGYPTYSVGWKQVGNDAIIEINHSASKPAITPTFTNPIELKLNRTPLQDTIIRFDITSNSDVFYLSNLGTLSTSATAIIDPNNWVINGVGSVSQDNSLSWSGIHENTLPSVTIYPNPSNGSIFVTGLESGEIVLRDMSGRIVYEGSFLENAVLDVENLSSGSYVAELINSEQAVRLIKLITIE